MQSIRLILLSILLGACNPNEWPELGECQQEFERYSVAPNSFEATPSRVYTHHGTPGGTWEIYFEQGWNYILPSNQKQWLKICGDALLQDIDDLSGNPNAVMLAARHDGKGHIEITPYYNKNGYSHYPELFAINTTWPVFEVNEKDLIKFSYRVEQSPSVPNGLTDYIITTLEVGDPVRLRAEHLFAMDGYLFQREINFYAGGSVPTVDFLTIRKRRICNEIPGFF